MSDENVTPEVEPEPEAPAEETEGGEVAADEMNFVIGEDGSVATQVGTVGGEPDEEAE